MSLVSDSRHALESLAESSGSQDRAGILEHPNVDEGELDKKLREVPEVGVIADALEVTLEEAKARGKGQVELESTQDQELHLKHVFFSVGAISYVDEVLDLRWVNLFVFARQEKGCDADKLELSFAAERRS